MSSSSPAAHGTDHPASARSDFLASFGWMALGAAALVGGLTMDRLENQDVNPYTVPGLLPGLLGIVMLLLGGTLMLRSLRQGGLHRPVLLAAAVPPGAARQLWLALGLCVVFDVALVGHGLPFWIAAALFVSVAILSLQHAQRRAAGQRLTFRAVVAAVAIGLGAGAGITLLFQQIFLVRLP
jgi:hypothetical protein